MNPSISPAGQSGDLFGPPPPIPRKNPVTRRVLPPEMTMASALCRQLRRKRAPQDKRRIAHLICLNLLSLLKHGA